MSYHVLKSHTMVFFPDQMHHWGTYLGKYKERSSAQNRHREGIMSTSDQLAMTSVMPWWEGGRKSVTQMLQILPDGDVRRERLHYLWVRLYSLKKSLEWKCIRHLAGKKALFTITHWPWDVHHYYNGKTVSKFTLTLDPPFLYFSGETHEKVPAFPPAEFTSLIDFCGVQEQRKRWRETGRERGRLLSPAPVIWLSSLGRERVARWLREAAEKIH